MAKAKKAAPKKVESKLFIDADYKYDWEERRKILFPNSPPPTLRQLKANKNNRNEQNK